MSKHLPAIARALGVSMEWLISGPIGPAMALTTKQPMLVGTVGKGGVIDAFPYGIASEDPAPFVDLQNSNIVQVKGKNVAPLRDGWLIFYEAEDLGVRPACVNRLCVVQVSQGARLVKILRKSNMKGLHRLESLDGKSKARDVRLTWAAPVICIRP